MTKLDAPSVYAARMSQNGHKHGWKGAKLSDKRREALARATIDTCKNALKIIQVRPGCR